MSAACILQVGMAHTNPGISMTCDTGRRRLVIGALGLAGSLVFPRRSSARQAGRVTLTDQLSLLTSGGTNVLALSTPDGLVVVDSGTSELSGRLMDGLRQLPGGRVAALFNTHWHPENT